MKKTKIICTLGPASTNEKIMKEMLLNGMNVARFNFSHGDHEEHKKRMDMFKKVRKELNMPAAILLDKSSFITLILLILHLDHFKWFNFSFFCSYINGNFFIIFIHY